MWMPQLSISTLNNDCRRIELPVESGTFDAQAALVPRLNLATLAFGTIDRRR